MTLEDAPSAARGPDGFRFGRYRGPIESPDFELGLRWRGRLKEWHYSSVSTPRLFFAFGIVRLGYATNVFAYWLDHQREGDAFELDSMSTGSRGVTFSESSTRGETRWSKGGAELRLRYEPRLMRVHADLEARGERLRADLVVEAGDESLGLLHDLGAGRPAYTHKAAGLRARGSVRLGDEAIVVDGSAVLDWTRSVARRRTVWKWVSFAGRSAGHHLGLNLSTDVYEDASGGRENALWVDGSMSVLGDVSVQMPPNAGVGDWVIRSREGDEVDLRFTPSGARSKDADYKLVRSRFVQPYGVFNGRVRGLDVVNLFGVVEDHESLW